MPAATSLAQCAALVPGVARAGKVRWKFFSVSGDVRRPGVHEAEVGTTLRQLIELCGGMRDGKALKAFLPGGASTEFLTASHADVVMDWKPLQEAGSSLGSGAVVVVAWLVAGGS